MSFENVFQPRPLLKFIYLCVKFVSAGLDVSKVLSSVTLTIYDT